MKLVLALLFLSFITYSYSDVSDFKFRYMFPCLEEPNDINFTTGWGYLSAVKHPEYSTENGLKFLLWCMENNRTYSHPSWNISETLQNRFALWLDSITVVMNHNSKDLPWFLGMTSLADYSDEEFQRLRNPWRIPHEEAIRQTAGSNSAGTAGTNQVSQEEEQVQFLQRPSFLDWRAFPYSGSTVVNAVGPVRNQMNCSSDWAYAATSVLESSAYLQNAYLDPTATSVIPLSSQQLIDCAVPQGCDPGHTVQNAWNYVQVRTPKMLCTYNDYPNPFYASAQVCRPNCSSSTSGVLYYWNISDISPTDIQRDRNLNIAVWIRGPVVAAVDMGGLKLYAGGIYTNATCDSQGQDMYVTVIGYQNSTNTHKFFTFKHSLGTTWGEGGYCRVDRPIGGNDCGLNKVWYYACCPAIPSDPCQSNFGGILRSQYLAKQKELKEPKEPKLT